MAGGLRGLRLLWLAGALAGCSWLPWHHGSGDESATAEAPADAGDASGSKPSEGPCTRKGRAWPEGSRVCEDHKVTRCFPDGVWRVIGSC
jgi:hypothetical protein